MFSPGLACQRGQRERARIERRHAPRLLPREDQAPPEEHAGRDRIANIGDAEVRGGVKWVLVDGDPRGEGR